MVEGSFHLRRNSRTLFQLSPSIKKDIDRMVIEAEAEGEKDIMLQVSVKVIRNDGSERAYDPLKVDIGVPQT
ncbi:MAG: hypothetical protein ACLFVP_05165 [Candidatus Bathyarchaeia archaeon]